MPKPDPMEKIVRDALKVASIAFVEADDPRARNLDFYLLADDVHVEVKQFHASRIAEQMSRAQNVIAIQGVGAAKLFAKMLHREERQPAAACEPCDHHWLDYAGPGYRDPVCVKCCKMQMDYER